MDTARPQARVLFVLGDSLTLPRPSESIAPEATWPFLVARALGREGEVLFFHHGAGGVTIDDVALEWTRLRDFVPPGPTICVLEAGIVDCAPRPLPRLLRSIVARLPSPLRAPLVAWIHEHRNGLNRFFSLLLLRSPRRTHLRRFQSTYRRLAGELARTFGAVVLVGIAPADDAYEQKSAGIKRSIALFEATIREAAATSGPNVSHADLHALLGATPETSGFVSRVDGHHLTSEGHARVAAEVVRLLGFGL